MGLKMGHHFTVPLMSSHHQFLVYTFNISVKTLLIHMVYYRRTLQMYCYIVYLYANIMKDHQHNIFYLVQLHCFHLLCSLHLHCVYFSHEQNIHSWDIH